MSLLLGLVAAIVSLQFPSSYSFQPLLHRSKVRRSYLTVATSRKLALAAAIPPPSSSSVHVNHPRDLTVSSDAKAQDKSFSKPRKPSYRRWASLPREGVEKRAVAWLQNNRLVATTYDW